MARRSANKGNGSKAIGYVRVSTDDQHLGPEAQRDALVRWCDANGAELLAVYVDHGVSGGAPLDKRPALLDALDALAENGAGVLLVAKRDRLARNVMIAAMVERMAERVGASIVAADGAGNGNSPEATLMRHMVDAFAEYERAIIRARTRTALAVKARKGERVGQVPFGYRLAADGVHLAAEPREQRVIALVQDLRAEGLTIRAIAGRLNADNVPARGKRWHPTTVSRMLARNAA